MTTSMDLAIQHVRRFTRDKPEKNNLLGGKYESEDVDVEQAIVDAIADWNYSQPPLPAINLDSHPAKHLLTLKAAATLLQSAGIWHSREHLPSSDGGTSADDHAKFSEYVQWVGKMEQEYEMKRDQLKQSINISLCYGGYHSEYAATWINISGVTNALR